MWLGWLPHLILKVQMAVAGTHTGVCLGINTTGTSTGTVIAGSVWLGGLATLVEKKSRRMELALYCASRALESFSR